YRYDDEHRDMRRVMGVGIAITRGAAAALSFCMAIVLLTVCRNIITVVRETPLGEFIPFDSAIGFHKVYTLFTSVFYPYTLTHLLNIAFYALIILHGLPRLFDVSKCCVSFTKSQFR
ncbi:hypothetical protein GCK32_016393, partial [Trichostrongylus colubriformis]